MQVWISTHFGVIYEQPTWAACPSSAWARRPRGQARRGAKGSPLPGEEKLLLKVMAISDSCCCGKHLIYSFATQAITTPFDAPGKRIFKYLHSSVGVPACESQGRLAPRTGVLAFQDPVNSSSVISHSPYSTRRRPKPNKESATPYPAGRKPQMDADAHRFLEAAAAANPEGCRG